MSGEDVMGWDDGTIWKIEEVVVKIAARLLPNQTLPDLHMSVGLWETVLAISLEQTLYKEDGTIWLEALKWNIYYDHMTHAITNLLSPSDDCNDHPFGFIASSNQYTAVLETRENFGRFVKILRSKCFVDFKWKPIWKSG